ncbi:MAG: hypothetical protein HY721_20625 [Planctomycetes bacterium]|nr:hypothetical protein [Planctomycetota bacterium]
MPAKSLGNQGVPVSTFTVDGPSLTGEATIEKGGRVEEAVRQLSREVETEPLPIEHREHIQRFHDLLLGGGERAEGK